MQRERVANDIYVFTSDLYAQVTAGAIVTSAGAVLIDTLVYPEETREIKNFVEGRLGARVQYIINTHFHADHTTGTCFFPDACVISHQLCRQLLDSRGRESLEEAKIASSDLAEIQIRLPDIVFEQGTLALQVGDKLLRLMHTPGHSPDSIVCLVDEPHLLFAADTVMPIPYFVDGDFEDFIRSLERLRKDRYENIIQGHGEVILPGEVDGKLRSDIAYLLTLRDAVDSALQSAAPENALAAITIEVCGKSRILLNGAAEQLHQQNVQALAAQRVELVRH